MDIIGHLTRTVSPAVLGDDQSPAKKSLLEQFYAIFAARLADKDTFGRFANENIARDDQSFYDRVWTDGSHRDSISRELAGAHNVDATAARGLVAMAAPLAYHEIKNLAGTTPVPQFLNDNSADYQHHIPAWASAVVPAGMIGASAGAAGTRISDTTSMAPLQHKEEESGSFMKALLPIIGLIILGALAWALLRGCQDNPEPVATPVVTEEQAEDDSQAVAAVAASAEPASIRIATGEANTLYACRMNVGDETLQTTVMNAMSSTFGNEADKCRADVDDNFATDMPAAAQLASILPIIKSVPNASMIIKGDEIVVNSADADVLDKLVSDLQAAAPAMTIRAEGPLDLQSEIDNSLVAAEAAVDNLGENPDPRDVARALSIQVINFELDKAVIPEVNKPFLDRAANIIQEVPNIELVIIGHTDNLASDAYNMELSRDRAESVKEYLVSKGVDASKLTTKGMGESDPIADNSTEQGRFRNRRIEFSVNDEATINNTGASGAITNDSIDPDLNPLDSNNDDMTVDGDDNGVDATMPDPDLNPLDNNNDDVLPDSDDPTQGTALDPQ
ncbi:MULTISPECIES: OmpA family protein [unclassified Psychrobacter]|uniref:OmpA family protein n=1 Tax=unclassified Psychrobacter TaxID=196806 RepID=UPI000946EF67|nr:MULTISPECIES: OmpA family protein [unclassified Psychrobacter]OLF37018.1 cell envelope biogenesis protein OmpA [Psychrobacter sp. Cmf 22.2]